MYFAQKNARLTSDQKIVQVLGELIDVEWDIVLFSETRANSQDCIVTGGHRLITHLDGYIGAGVGILVNSRWTRCIQKVHIVSDRILAIDMLFGNLKARVVSVYMPHAGFNWQKLFDVYNQLSLLLTPTLRARQMIIVGGDFNTALNVGHRGDCLADFCNNFELSIANSNGLDLDHNQWTFKSWNGSLRRIDYVCHSTFANCDESSATSVLDLGSDHRAVHAALQIYFPKTQRRHRKKPTRGWRPKLDSRGHPSDFHKILDDSISVKRPVSAQDFNELIVQAASVAGDAANSRASICKPHKSQHLKVLLRERKLETRQQERKQLSKRIHKETRRAL